MIIAIGSNLRDADGATPLQICERALRSIGDMPGTKAAVRSRWYSSAPVPPSDQPRYINGVVQIETGLKPTDLLAALQSIEKRAGRRRTVPDAARTLDLDIIDMDGRVQDTPDPILPHPRAHLRGFVLYPLRDVAPFWVHPLLHVGVSTLIGRLDQADLCPQ